MLENYGTYKIKYKFDGAIERFKAHTHIKGLNFIETFIPVVKLISVIVFLSVIVTKMWELHHMDVNNAFLDGDLHEEVHMKLPPCFTISLPNKACRLSQPLYGLYQFP